MSRLGSPPVAIRMCPAVTVRFSASSRTVLGSTIAARLRMISPTPSRDFGCRLPESQAVSPVTLFDQRRPVEMQPSTASRIQPHLRSPRRSEPRGRRASSARSRGSRRCRRRGLPPQSPPVCPFVIGAGSAGFRAARRAGELGKRVAIAEEDRVGGTCVLRGCVPKKLFVHAGPLRRGLGKFGWLRLAVGRSAFRLADASRQRGRRHGLAFGSLYPQSSRSVGAEIIRSRAVMEDPDHFGCSRKPHGHRRPHPDRDRRRAKARPADPGDRTRHHLQRVLQPSPSAAAAS